jgi:Spy/CpxP family protein refolding chaperone
MLRKFGFVVALFLLSALALCAQTSPSSGTPPAQTRPLNRGNGEPCWQVAGVEKSVMEQRWALERDTRSQVNTVCSDTSLTPQQKQQKAREIRQQARQKMDALMTPDQEKKLTTCQAERGMNHPGGGEGAGGCGEWSRQGPRRNGSGSNNGSSNPGGGSSPQ